MTYAIVAGVLAAVLLLVQRMLSRARVDHVINSLRPDEEKAKADHFATELERVNQEIKDADIRFNNAKRAALKSDNTSK